jgi:hypothetical protein
MARKPCTHNRSDVKRAIELMEALGKTVTAVKYHPDGTFRVMTSDHVSKRDPTNGKTSYWDKALGA